MLPCEFTGGNLAFNENYLIIKKKIETYGICRKNFKIFGDKKGDFTHVWRFSRFLYLGPLWIFMATIE